LLKSFINLILLFTVPSIALYPDNPFPVTTIESYEQVKDLITSHIFSYDDILNFITAIEEGELENNCNAEDLEKIQLFLINLATQGILPNEDPSILANDIQELLQENDESEISFYLNETGSYFFLPTIAYSHGDIILCKSWLSKKWKQVRNFVKKHKIAIIIGAAAVVAVAVVVCVVAASTAASTIATGAGAVGAAAADSDNKDKKKSEKSGTKASTSTADSSSPPNVVTTEETPMLQEVLKENISDFKESIVENNLLPSDASDESKMEDKTLVDQVGKFVPILAHETLDGVAELASCVPEFMEEVKEAGHKLMPDALLADSEDINVTPLENYEKIVTKGHEIIDQVFSTNYADQYTPEAKADQPQMTLEMMPPPGGGSKGFSAAESSSVGKEAEMLNRLKTAGNIPKSSELLQLVQKNSSITTKDDVLKIIKPNGQWIGKEGTSNYIRICGGGQNEANQIFQELTKGGKLVENSSYPGELRELVDLQLDYGQSPNLDHQLLILEEKT
jgi:hypothetical protein